MSAGTAVKKRKNEENGRSYIERKHEKERKSQQRGIQVFRKSGDQYLKYHLRLRDQTKIICKRHYLGPRAVAEEEPEHYATSLFIKMTSTLESFLQLPDLFSSASLFLHLHHRRSSRPNVNLVG